MKILRICDLAGRLAHLRNLSICDSAMSPRICGFSIFGLRKKCACTPLPICELKNHKLNILSFQWNQQKRIGVLGAKERWAWNMAKITLFINETADFIKIEFFLFPSIQEFPIGWKAYPVK
jgi:hypothetical protein